MFIFSTRWDTEKEQSELLVNNHGESWWGESKYKRIGFGGIKQTDHVDVRVFCCSPRHDERVIRFRHGMATVVLFFASSTSHWSSRLVSEMKHFTMVYGNIRA